MGFHHNPLLPVREPSYPGGNWPNQPNFPSEQENPDSGIVSKVLHTLGKLWRWKWLILVAGVLGTAFGYGRYILTPEMYKAWVTLELTGFNESFMGLNAVDPQAGTGNYSPTGLNLMTQLKVIESRSLRQPVLERLQREMTPTLPPQRGWHGKIRNRLGLAQDDPLQAMRVSLAMAAGSASARIVPGTRIIMISTDSTQPEVASNFVNTLADEFISQNIQQRSSNAQKTTQWLAGQIEEAKFKLEQSEAKLHEFINKSNLVYVADGSTLVDLKLRQLQASLAGIQSDRISKEAKYQQARTAPPETLPDVVDDPGLREYQKKLADLRRERAMLSTTLTPEHYKMKQIEVQLASLDASVKLERESLLRRIRNDFEAAQQRESLLIAEHAAISRQLAGQAGPTAQYSVLRREVETLRQSLGLLMTQASQAGVVSAVQTANVRLLDAAVAPGEPYMPTPFRTTFGGLMTGLALACGFGLLWELAVDWATGRKLSLPGHASSLLSVPELGVIPSAESGVRKPFALLAAGGDPQTPEVELIPGCPNSPQLVESYRLVLASLAMLDSQRGSRAFVVTSAEPGEGKTTITANVGRMMAETGRKVLLLDCDLRRPRLHSVFGLHNTRGFSDLLTKLPATAAEIDAVIQETGHNGLYLMTAGQSLGRAINQLFYSNEVKTLLETLRARFDTILIDTPPILSFSEARLVGRSSDGVILVVRAGKALKQAVLASRHRIAADGIPIIGAVLNDWDPSSAGAEHSYYGKAQAAYAMYASDPPES